MKSKYLVCTLLTPSFVALDQFTKVCVLSRLQWGDSWPAASSFFAISHVHNEGAVFGLLHSEPGIVRAPLFVITPLLAIWITGTVLRRLEDAQHVVAGAIALVFAGAIGNLIDRVRLGYVVDFLDFHIGRYHWPAFNVADICLAVGILILLVSSGFPWWNMTPRGNNERL